MIRYTETKILPYSCGDMFELVMDVEAYPSFLPWCHKAQILLKEKEIMKADLWVGVDGLSKVYRSRIDFQSPSRIQVTQEEGPFKVLHNLWSFHPLEGEKCRIEFSIEFSFQSKLLSLLMDHAFEKASQKMIAAFEERAHFLYSSPKESPI